MVGEPKMPTPEELAKQNQNEGEKRKLTEEELKEKSKKFKVEFEKGIDELNQELFNGEKVLITKNVSPTIESYWNFIDETKDDDSIIKELLAREIEAALIRVESLKEGINPKGGFAERSKIMSKKDKEEEIEQLIDPQEANEKIEKLRSFNSF